MHEYTKQSFSKTRIRRGRCQWIAITDIAAKFRCVSLIWCRRTLVITRDFFLSSYRLPEHCSQTRRRSRVRGRGWRIRRRRLRINRPICPNRSWGEISKDIKRWWREQNNHSWATTSNRSCRIGYYNCASKPKLQRQQRKRENILPEYTNAEAGCIRTQSGQVPSYSNSKRQNSSSRCFQWEDSGWIRWYLWSNITNQWRFHHVAGPQFHAKVSHSIPTVETRGFVW